MTVKIGWCHSGGKYLAKIVFRKLTILIEFDSVLLERLLNPLLSFAMPWWGAEVRWGDGIKNQGKI